MGHFEFQLLNGEGMPYGEVHKVVSVQGVCLLSHPSLDPVHIGHLTRLAQDTPDYPHDLCLWEGPDPNATLRWSARIHYRRK